MSEIEWPHGGVLQIYMAYYHTLGLYSNRTDRYKVGRYVEMRRCCRIVEKFVEDNRELAKNMSAYDILEFVKDRDKPNDFQI